MAIEPKVPAGIDAGTIIALVGLVISAFGVPFAKVPAWKWSFGIFGWVCVLALLYELTPLTRLTLREQAITDVLLSVIVGLVALQQTRRNERRIAEPDSLASVTTDARDLAAKIRAFMAARKLSHPSDRLSRLYDESRQGGSWGREDLISQVGAAEAASPAHEQDTLGLYYDRFTKPVKRMRDRLAAHGLVDADFDKLLARLPESLTDIVELAHYLTALGQVPK